GMNGLSPVRIGYPNHRGLLDGRVFVQSCLYFGGEDILAPGNDHVFLAIDQVDISVIVDGRQVASVEPPISDRRGSIVGTPPVANHDVWPARDYFTDLARSHQSSIVGDYTDLDARDWLAT